MRAQLVITAMILLSFLLLNTVSGQAENDFDTLLKQAENEKQAQWQMYEGEIQRIDAKFERLWQERKDEIEKKWDEALRSTNKEWVDYSPSLDARSYVNFEEGFVEIAAIVPVEGKEVVPKAEELIAGQIRKVFSEDNVSGQNLLIGQVSLKPGYVVSPNTLSLFMVTHR